jgi:hypothetical protein
MDEGFKNAVQGLKKSKEGVMEEHFVTFYIMQIASLKSQPFQAAADQGLGYLKFCEGGSFYD